MKLKPLLVCGLFTVILAAPSVAAGLEAPLFSAVGGLDNPIASDAAATTPHDDPRQPAFHHYTSAVVSTDHHDGPHGQVKYLRPDQAPVWLTRDQGDTYGMEFKCPNAPSTSIGEAQADSSVCPMVIWDVEDLMGQPQLVVNQQRPRLMVFNALHGGIGIHVGVDPANPGKPDTQPPTPRSRYNFLHQPHTNFWTDNMGSAWNDEPYKAPDHLVASGRKVFGEDNAAVLDNWGRLYHVSSYSYAKPTDPAFQWGVAAWMHQRTNQRSYGYTDVVMLKPDNETNRIEQLGMAISHEAGRVFALWRETSPDNASRSPFVNVYYSDIGDGLNWERIETHQRVGPCRAITNPIAFKTKVFFGCMPGEGWSAANASSDYIQIYELDANALMTRHVASTPVTAGNNAVLAARGHNGHMILAAGGIDNGKPFVRISYGQLGERWSDPQDYGDEFSDARAAGEQGKTVADARVTALAYTEKTGFVHLIYMERYELSSDPRKVDPTQVRPQTLYKSYGVVRPSHAFKGKFDINFGNPDACKLALHPEWQGPGDGVFDDLHDSVVVIKDPTNEKERIFVAYGEYGCVRFAEVVEKTVLVGPVLPPLAPPPIPLAAAATQPAWEAAAAGLIAGLMFLRLLRAKRKLAVAAPS